MKPKRYWKRNKQYAFWSKDHNLIGVYFLLSGKSIVYIGKTTNIVARMYGHNEKKYDRFRLIVCDEGVIDLYEKRWISKFQPAYNTIHTELQKLDFNSRCKKRKIAWRAL